MIIDMFVWYILKLTVLNNYICHQLTRNSLMSIILYAAFTKTRKENPNHEKNRPKTLQKDKTKGSTISRGFHPSRR